MPITLYMIPLSPPARAVLVTAEALGVKLTTKLVDLSKQEQLAPEYLKINPQHTVPVLDDNGTIICESHAIIAYLVGKYGKTDELYPKDLAKRAQVDQRLHFDNGMVFATLRKIVRDMKYKGAKTVKPDFKADAEEVYDFLEKFLEGKKWITGDTVTIADISLVTSATALGVLVPIDPKKWPKVTGWIQQALALDYFGVNKAGFEDLVGFIKSLMA